MPFYLDMQQQTPVSTLHYYVGYENNANVHNARKCCNKNTKMK